MHAPGYEARKKKAKAKRKKLSAKTGARWQDFERKDRKQESICDKNPTSRRCERAQIKALKAGYKYDRAKRKTIKQSKKIKRKYYD